MEAIDFKEKNLTANYCHYKDDDDFMDNHPKGDLHYRFNDYFKNADKHLKFIPANRNTIFELIIKNINIKPYRIHCYDKVQIYHAGKRRSIPINFGIFREFLGIKDREHEAIKFKLLINNGMRINQLLFSENEI